MKRLFVVAQYHYLNVLDRDDKEILFMNYGYLDADTPEASLDPHEEKDRCAIQMYHRVAGAIDLAGKDALEVGCGRGGGAAYVMRRLKPKSMIAVDLCRSTIAFCRSYYDVPGLEFREGMAEKMALPDAAFDVVINIESSHCYLFMHRFLREVRRVLRPGGHLLFADFRSVPEMGQLRGEFAKAGFTVVEEERMNKPVLRALDHEHDRKVQFIERKIPGRRRALFEAFAATKGSGLYDALRSGSVEYWRFVLKRGE
jgi:ubiquinone/menaquinone biosynthesis C-methylase UbiE